MLSTLRFVACCVVVPALMMLAPGCRGETTEGTEQLRPLKVAEPINPKTGAGERQDLAGAVSAEEIRGRARLAANGSAHGATLTDDEEEGEDKYWDGVDFGMEQLDEMLEFITQEYIEEKVDESRAYVSAINFALSQLEPAHEMLPMAYYKRHKDDPEVVLKDEDRDELTLKRRDYFRARSEELQDDWKGLKFGRKDFQTLMKSIEKRAQRGEKKVSSSRLWLAAAQGYLYALDPHSSLVSKKAWEESTRDTQDSSFDGIGALLTQRFEPSKTLRNRLKGKTKRLDEFDSLLLVELKEEDKLRRRTFVESPMSGQPAEKAGVWAGDEIIKVDGVSVIDMPLDKVVGMIRGKGGTEVRLTVLREGVPGEIELGVTRAHIRVTNVEGKPVDSHPCIGYVKLTGFIETSYSDLAAEIESLQEKCGEGGGLRGLVFDLRNNSGGLLSQGVKIANLFVAKGKIVTVKNRRKRSFLGLMDEDEVYQAQAKGTLALPLVVLVNDGSASASEIVASALQDNQRGLIVGERTFGKASVQTLINPFRGKGYYIKLTIARYYSPSDRTLQVVGVNPDVTVAPEIGGKMPLGFREEDLSNHLPKIDSAYDSANRELVGELKDCVAKRGTAKRIFKDNPHPQIKFDHQLYVAADYLECLIDRERPLELDIVDLEPGR